MERGWINAEELVPRKRPKKYDKDLLESETLRLCPLRGCGELPPITYTSKEIEREASSAYQRELRGLAT